MISHKEEQQGLSPVQEQDFLALDILDDCSRSQSRYYPLPRINKETIKKELMRLVDIEVLTQVQQSERGTPVFIKPLNDGTLHFVTDYWKVN